jgi:hypothetical protein
MTTPPSLAFDISQPTSLAYMFNYHHHHPPSLTEEGITTNYSPGNLEHQYRPSNSFEFRSTPPHTPISPSQLPCPSVLSDNTTNPAFPPTYFQLDSYLLCRDSCSYITKEGFSTWNTFIKNVSIDCYPCSFRK